MAVGVWLAALAAVMLTRLTTTGADGGSVPQLALLLAGGVLFALLGGVVHRWAADALLGGVFLLLSAGFGSALVALPAMLIEERWAGCIVAAGGLLAAGSLASVCMLFPRRIRGARKVVFGAIGTAATLAAAQVWAQGIGSPSGTFVSVLDGLSSAWIVISLFGSLVVLFMRSWRRSDRQALAPLLIGTAVGVLPVGTLYLVPRAIGLTPSLQPETALIALAAIPTSFAYSILRHQALGLDALLRRVLLRSSGVLISAVLFFLVRSFLRIGGIVRTDSALVGARLTAVLVRFRDMDGAAPRPVRLHADTASVAEQRTSPNR